MSRSSTSVRASVAGILALAGMMLATPAGAFEILDTNGNPGLYAIKDAVAKPAVTCRFEDHGGQLDDELHRVRARKLRIRGHKPFDTWVGYRFRVYQRMGLSTDYEPVFKGPLAKRRASASDPARFGARSWSPPEDLPPSDYRVIVDLVWYRAGSKSEVRGKVRGVMEIYRHTHPAEAPFVFGSPGDGGECFYNFYT